MVLPVAAQGLEDVIPSDPPPLRKVFPPAEDEMENGGLGKFVIFTREKSGKKNTWDFVAGAWECIPSRPDLPVTKRLEFCQSPWAADALLDTLSGRSEGLFPQFAKLQVKSGVRGFATNLYAIDYQTWEVECLWQGPRLHAFGAIGNTIFCSDIDHKPLQLDVETRELSYDVPFVPLFQKDGFWVVRKQSDPPTTDSWSYDLERRKFISRFKEVERGRFSWSILSDDGTHQAWIMADPPDGWRKAGMIEGKLILQRPANQPDIVVPVEIYARPGSGRPVIPLGLQLRFTADAVELETPDAEQAEQWRKWRIALKDGTVTSETGAADPLEDNDEQPTTFDDVPLADYLHPRVHEFSHFGRGGLAPAFLMHQGILKKAPEFPDCEAAASPDGRHILYRADDGPLAGEFIYGDLHEKKVVRWKSPEKLPIGSSLNIVWVPAPKPRARRSPG